MHFTGPPIKLRASFLKRWASCQLVPPSRPPLWPIEVLSVLHFFLERSEPRTHSPPWLLGMPTRTSRKTGRDGIIRPFRTEDLQCRCSEAKYWATTSRMVVDFTMFNQGKTVRCAISTAAMDDLEGKHEVKADQRVDQFLRLRDAIEERASRKFFERPVHAEGPVVLRSNDFFK
jgi:Protein of unknown function (DUF1488)